MENYKVYKHTFPNGKVYIGITQQTLIRRWQNGKGYYKNSFISKAINKYGWENVKHEVLFENLTKEEAEKKEIELIAFYKSTTVKFGYNIDNGGYARGKHSEKTIQKMRESKLGAKNGMYGKKLSPENRAMLLSYSGQNKGKKMSDETKQKLRDKLKGRIISEETRKKMSESRKGKKMSEQARNNISKSRKGIVFSDEHKKKLAEKNRQRAKKITCVETGKTFVSLREASKVIGCNHSNLSKSLNKNKKVYGYHWIMCEE